MATTHILILRIFPKSWSKCIQIIFGSHPRKLCEYIPHVVKRIDDTSLTRYYYGVYNSRSLTRFWMTNKNQFFLPIADGLIAFSTRLFIYPSFSMLDMCDQGLPVFTHIVTGFTQTRLRQHFRPKSNHYFLKPVEFSGIKLLSMISSSVCT